MTEEVWLACTETRSMLRYLLGLRPDELRVQAVEAFPACRTSDRKLRLFACACYRRIRHLLPDRRAEAAVEVAERVADGFMPVQVLLEAEASIRVPIDNLEGRWRASRGRERVALLPTHEALALGLITLWPQAPKAAYYASSNAYLTAAAIANPGAASSDKKYSASRVAEERVQTDLLRDIFGHPFRPVTAEARWLTSTAAALAQAIYTERAFDRLPILADALEEAGCDEPAVLAHCRSGGPHVRGCWVVDLVLGQE